MKIRLILEIVLLVNVICRIFKNKDAKCPGNFIAKNADGIVIGILICLIVFDLGPFIAYFIGKWI